MLAVIFTGEPWQLAAGIGVLLLCLICAAVVIALCRAARNQTHGNRHLAERPIGGKVQVEVYREDPTTSPVLIIERDGTRRWVGGND